MDGNSFRLKENSSTVQVSEMTDMRDALVLQRLVNVLEVSDPFCAALSKIGFLD